MSGVVQSSSLPSPPTSAPEFHQDPRRTGTPAEGAGAPAQPGEALLRNLRSEAHRLRSSIGSPEPVGDVWLPEGRTLSASSSELAPDHVLIEGVRAGVAVQHREAAVFSLWADPGEETLLQAERALDPLVQQGAMAEEDLEPTPRKLWGRAVRSASRLLKAVRKRPGRSRRIMALWLVCVLVGVAAGEAPDDADEFVQRLASDAVPEARAAAAHARLAVDPFEGRQGSLIPQMASRALLAHLKDTAAGAGAPARRAHAMDPQAMLEASPLAAEGAADERARKTLGRTAADLRARLARGETGRGPAAGEAPRVDPVRLIRAHLDTAEYCAHCRAGNCHIYEVAAIAEGCPAPFFTGQRPPAAGLTTGHATYPLPAEEVTRQSAAVAKLAANGRIAPCVAPLVTSPTFFAYKNRFAQSLEWAEAQFASPSVIDCLAREAAPVLAAIALEGPPTAGSVTRALGAASISDGGRMVFDYGQPNERGCAWPFALCSIAEIVMSASKGAAIASVDIETGFHHVAIAPGDSPYFAFRDLVSGKTYAPTRLMFGMRSAPAAFSTVTAEIVASAQRRLWQRMGADCGVRLFVYIDDIFVVGGTSSSCTKALALLRDFCVEVGVKLKEEKVRPPAQDAPVLGLRIDTQRQVVYLPADKRWNMLFAIHVLLHVAAQGGGLPTAQLEKLAGKLNHFCIVWPRGVAHMAPLYQAASGAAQGMLPPSRGAGALSALQYFYDVLQRQHADSFCAPLPASPDAPAEIISHGDASGDVGFSVQMGPLQLWGRWTPVVASAKSIGNKELYPLALWEELFGDLIEGFAWSPRMDNLPNCFAILKGYTADRDLQPLLTAWLCARGRDATRPGWEPRLYNPFQDKVSKAVSWEEVPRLMEAYAYARITGEST